MTSFTKQRTHSREAWEAAQLAWRSGEYRVDLWREWRHLAAGSGIIAPPVGTRWDSWTDDKPSERALIARAIEDTPVTLRSILRSGRCHSWSMVVRELMQDRDGRGMNATDAERSWAIRREGMTPVRSIVQTIMDSLDRPERGSRRD